MSEPVRDAFCPVYYGANGGLFDQFGKPAFTKDSWTRGNCDRPWDCGACHYMHQWVPYLQSQGWGVGWECRQCLFNSQESDEAQNLERSLPGFYQSGWPDDPDNPMPDGCTRCGYKETSFLQLILRRPKGSP